MDTCTKRADLQQFFDKNRSTADYFSSPESVFSLLETLSLNTLHDVKTTEETQTNNRSADDLQHVEAQKTRIIGETLTAHYFI